MFRSLSGAVRRRPVLILLAIMLPALMLHALVAFANEARPTTALPSQPTAAGLGHDTITVTNTSASTGVGSLRWALRQATGGETIRFHPALAGATITVGTTLHVPFYVTLEGPRTGGITISGGGNVRVLQVYRGASLRNVLIAGEGDHVTAGGIDRPGALEPQNGTAYNDAAPTVRGPYIGSVSSSTARSRATLRARSRPVSRTVARVGSGSLNVR